MSLLSIEWLSMMRPSNGSVYATRDTQDVLPFLLDKESHHEFLCKITSVP